MGIKMEVSEDCEAQLLNFRLRKSIGNEESENITCMRWSGKKYKAREIQLIGKSRSRDAEEIWACGEE